MKNTKKSNIMQKFDKRSKKCENLSKMMKNSEKL
jgi:hypothetical protein